MTIVQILMMVMLLVGLTLSTLVSCAQYGSAGLLPLLVLLGLVAPMVVLRRARTIQEQGQSCLSRLARYENRGLPAPALAVEQAGR